jgi:uncharacterized protein (DUF885 family)
MRSLVLVAMLPSLAAAHPLTQKYLDGLFAAKPHLATFMGDHRFDDKLVDLSPAALAKRQTQLDSLKAELRALPQAKDLDERIDAEILSDAIELELLYLREIRDWEWDPRISDSFPYYDPRDVLGDRLSFIIHGEYAPEAERRKAVAGQLAALPGLLSELRTCLMNGKRHVPAVYLSQAQSANKARIETFETEIKAFTAADAKAEAARQKAVAALRDYQKFLDGDLPKRADGDWRLGKELYAKKFKYALGTTQSPEAVAARARQVFEKSSNQLYDVALKLHYKLWPNKELKASRAAVIEAVNKRLAEDHCKPAELVDAHGRNIDSLRAFLTAKNLLELPPKETLNVQPMPAYKRGAQAAEYLAPFALDKNPVWRATYSVDPVDPTWSAERVESYLRGQNDYQVQLVAAHEAYPGHHTQYFYSRKNPDPLRAVLWNAAMVEGWAVYGEGLIVENGWGADKNDAFQFYNLRGHLSVAANIILDIELQSGRMTDAEAVRFLVEQAFQPKAMADKKLVRAKLDSTQLAQYFLGWDEIRALEKDWRKKNPKGTQREFNEALIGHGSLAVRFLRQFTNVP